MAHRLHPLGELNQDLKYKDVYRWFNCMEMGPCHGWMTSNSTLRRITTKHARQLTRVLKHVVTREKFSSFDIHFVDNPFRKVIDDWLDGGGEVWELIEPVDSLHPTQAAQKLIAEALWKHLEKELPHVLGPANPRNDLIRGLFKDQGGH
jgi:acyloxyacyl hydrolase